LIQQQLGPGQVQKPVTQKQLGLSRVLKQDQVGNSYAVKQTQIKRPHRPAELDHQIQLRDQGQCAEKDFQGNRCTQTRWLDVHHIIPVEHGGLDTLENLITLCRSHHRMVHAQLG